MAKLNKRENGLTFYDDFKEPTLLWSLSPSDADNIRFGSNGLIMLHHRRYTTLTMTEPEAEEYSCIVELDHIPHNFDDIGGIIVISNNKEYAECQSFLATGPSELGNSNLIQADINEMIKIILDGSYVRYTMDDKELVDPFIQGPDDSSTSEETTDKEESEEKPFVDTFYKFIKFTKQKYKYVFWASEDSIHWIEVGNVSFESSGVIGFFLYGTTDQGLIEHSHFNVKSISIYSSRYLTIDSIPRAYEFEIIDCNGNILLRTDSISYAYMMNRSNNRCLINTVTLPMPIRNAHLRLYPKNDYENTIATYELGENVYGGDIFTLEHNIKAFIDNKEINPTELFDLGIFSRGNYRILMILKNCEDYVLPSIKLHVEIYSEYYAGHEEVDLALPTNTTSIKDLEYSKTVTIDNFAPNTTVPVYIRLTDEVLDKFYHVASVYRFKIIIE